MQGLNTVIQSSASDLVVDAALKAQEKFDAEGLDAHVLLLVHDEIIAEACDADAARAEKILDEAMTNYVLTTDMGSIKLKVEGKVSERWEK
jgi:DNA polymerase-1